MSRPETAREAAREALLLLAASGVPVSVRSRDVLLAAAEVDLDFLTQLGQAARGRHRALAPARIRPVDDAARMRALLTPRQMPVPSRRYEAPTDEASRLRWALNYIRARYNSPRSAWEAWRGALDREERE